jgi:pilus assembly protein FimV
MNHAFVRAVTTVSLLLAWGCAHALGLGQPTINSDLSSPLRVDIPITNIAGSGVDPDALLVDVPGFNEHAQLGFPEPIVPAGLEVTLLRDDRGGARLRLSTRLAAREPVLRFLLRATWPGGSTVREYTLLLDLPAAAAPPARASAATAIAARSARAPSPPPRGSLAGNPFQAPAAARAGSRYGPVAMGDTLHAVLASAYATRASDALARAIVARNPHAFANGDPDRLLLGATLDLPPAAQLADAATSPADRASASSMADRTASTSPHVVRPGDTLYAIARTLPDGRGAGLAGVVQRLYERNPQAFIDGDINRLRVGASLTLDHAATASAAATATTRPPPAVTAVPGAPGPVAAASAQEMSRLQDELAQVQGVVAAERERQLTLRERLARMEAEVASLRERDSALTAATESLRERVAAAASSPPPAAARTAAAPQSPAAAARTAAVPQSAAVVRPASAPAAAQPAAAPRSATSAVAAAAVRAPVASPDYTLLSAGALVLLALLALLFVRLRRSGARIDAAHAARHLRDGEEEATQRRLAEVRDAHANRTSEPQVQQVRTKSASSPANVRLTDTARASALAKEAAVHLAYGDHAAAHTSILDAIRLAPHQDEHKMMLMTVYQAKGQHDKARGIVDELLNRREQLSGEVRAQVEKHAQRQ